MANDVLLAPGIISKESLVILVNNLVMAGRVNRQFEDQFGAPNGAYFHVDMIPTRMLMNRPAPGLGGYKTPFEGLYLASAGSHPSGGVCGWAGRLAAETALQAA